MLLTKELEKRTREVRIFESFTKIKTTYELQQARHPKSPDILAYDRVREEDVLFELTEIVEGEIFARIELFADELRKNIWAYIAASTDATWDNILRLTEAGAYDKIPGSIGILLKDQNIRQKKQFVAQLVSFFEKINYAPGTYRSFSDKLLQEKVLSIEIENDGLKLIDIGPMGGALEPTLNIFKCILEKKQKKLLEYRNENPDIQINLLAFIESFPLLGISPLLQNRISEFKQLCTNSGFNKVFLFNCSDNLIHELK